jgi:hypothetical protein
MELMTIMPKIKQIATKNVFSNVQDVISKMIPRRN